MGEPCHFYKDKTIIIFFNIQQVKLPWVLDADPPSTYQGKLLNANKRNSSLKVGQIFGSPGQYSHMCFFTYTHTYPPNTYTDTNAYSHYPPQPIVPDPSNPKQKTLVLICFQKGLLQTTIKCAEQPEDAHKEIHVRHQARLSNLQSKLVAKSPA